MYGTDLLKCDTGLQTLARMTPGTEVTEDVYKAIKAKVHPLPLPDATRVHSPVGISEGFLYGRAFGARPEGTVYLAFGMTRYRGTHYYFLGLSTIDGKEHDKRPDYKRALRDPNYLMKVMNRGGK